MSILAVSRSKAHTYSKQNEPYIYLLKDEGVQGDIHCKPMSNKTNLRQVHLIESELFQYLAKPDKHGHFYQVYAGDLGENITTFGIKLGDLQKGSKIYFGNEKDCAVVKITGLRCPGKRFEEKEGYKGLMKRFLSVGVDKKKGDVKLWKREVGVMGVVERDGYVIPGQVLRVEHPKHAKALEYLQS